LFPDLSLDHVLAELLLERTRRNLIKYQTMARRFEAKANNHSVPFAAGF
jgi:hypothetical protein